MIRSKIGLLSIVYGTNGLFFTH